MILGFKLKPTCLMGSRIRGLMFLFGLAAIGKKGGTRLVCVRRQLAVILPPCKTN